MQRGCRCCYRTRDGTPRSIGADARLPARVRLVRGVRRSRRLQEFLTAAGAWSAVRRRDDLDALRATTSPTATGCAGIRASRLSRARSACSGHFGHGRTASSAVALNPLGGAAGRDCGHRHPRCQHLDGCTNRRCAVAWRSGEVSAGVYAAVLTASLAVPVVFWTLARDGSRTPRAFSPCCSCASATSIAGMRASRRYAVAVLATGLVLTRDDGIVLVIASVRCWRVCSRSCRPARQSGPRRRHSARRFDGFCAPAVASLVLRHWVPNAILSEADRRTALVDWSLARRVDALWRCHPPGRVRSSPTRQHASCGADSEAENPRPRRALCRRHVRLLARYVGGDAWEFSNSRRTAMSLAEPAGSLRRGRCVPRAAGRRCRRPAWRGDRARRHDARWSGVGCGRKIRLPYFTPTLLAMGGRDDGRRCCRPVWRASAAPASQRRRVDGARISRRAQRGAATRAVGAVELSDVRQRSRRDPGGLCGARIDVAAGVNRGHPCRLWTALCEKAFNRSSWQERSSHRDAAVRRLLSRARQDGPSSIASDASGRCRDVI